MDVHTVRFTSEELPVEIIYSPHRHRTVSLEVHLDKVLVRAPHMVSAESIDALIERRKSWLHKRWQALQERLQRQFTEEKDPSGTGLWLFGQPLTADVKYTPMNSYTVHAKSDAHLSIHGPAHTPRDLGAQAAMVEWLKAQAMQTIPARVQQWAAQIGATYNKIRIKDQRSRWGSCSSQRNLNFNWRLVQVPEFVLDYVVVHELCHLWEMNHSTRFWSLVGTHFPRYEEARIWLRQNGVALLH
ncbi:M48 family peptidase [Alicyclobacillaceae bacterium I2511]|nr:M48 family peptidase [Alicyclobacillaceae bacterium I2511]